VLTVNCSAFSNGGQGSATSCNDYTLHEDIVGIDVAGIYGSNHGKSIACIDTTKTYVLASKLINDYGDIPQGGTAQPTAISVADTAVLYVDSATIDQPAGTYAFSTTANSSIFYRNMLPIRQSNTGAGTVSAY